MSCPKSRDQSWPIRQEPEREWLPGRWLCRAVIRAGERQPTSCWASGLRAQRPWRLIFVLVHLCISQSLNHWRSIVGPRTVHPKPIPYCVTGTCLIRNVDRTLWAYLRGSDTDSQTNNNGINMQSQVHGGGFSWEPWKLNLREALQVSLAVVTWNAISETEAKDLTCMRRKPQHSFTSRISANVHSNLWRTPPPLQSRALRQRGRGT